MIKYLFSLALFCLTLGVFGQDGEYQFHEVEKGETLYSISQRYDVSIERLRKFNPDVNEGLKIGMKLLIPDPGKGEADQPKIEVSKRYAGPDSNFVLHTVKAGQTVFSLSQAYGVKTSDIYDKNPQLKDGGLKVGMELKIPVSKKEKQQTPKEILENYYVIEIEPKQTAYSISKKFDLSLDSIYLLNPGAESGLQIGQYLKLPKNRQPEEETIVEREPTQPQEQLNTDKQLPDVSPQEKKENEGYLLYQIKTGDSFYSLKQRYGIDRDELVRLNPEVARGLEVDKYIIIPQKQEEDQKEETFFDKLFSKVEESEQPKGRPDANQLAKKDSLNMDYPAQFPEGDRPKVIEDTLKVDYDKNYLVAVMLPFKNDPDTLLGEIGPVQKMAMDFYNGLDMAADSLTNAGMYLTLNVYDTRNSKEKLQRDISRIRRTNFDMVIGPLYKNNVEFVADQLKYDEVPVISPLSRTVDVRNRPNLINVLPGDVALAENIANILDLHYRNARVVFAHEGDAPARDLVRQIKARLHPRDTGNFVDHASSVEGASIDREQLKVALAEDRPNVVVILSENKVFLSGLVNSLRQLRDYDIKAVGPSRMMDIPTLDLNYLNDMALTMPDVHFVNYSDSATLNFIRAYRERYGTEPSRYAFQGYDVGMYFLNKLWRSGTYFNLAIEDQQALLGTGFRIRKSPDGGYGNDFMYTTGIREFVLVKLEEEQSVERRPKTEDGGENRIRAEDQPEAERRE